MLSIFPSQNSFSLSEKYTKIDVGWGFAPDITEGAYSAPLNPLAGLAGFASGQEGNGRREGLGEGDREREKGEWEREEKRGSWGNSTLLVGG